jgi:hypothetical protein
MTRRIRIIPVPKPLDPERFVAVVVAQAMAQLAEEKLVALEAREPKAAGEEGDDE